MGSISYHVTLSESHMIATPYKETLVPHRVATLIYLSQIYSYYIRGDRSPLNISNTPTRSAQRRYRTGQHYQLHRHRAINPRQPRMNEPLRCGSPANTRYLEQMPLLPCRASAADAGPTAKQQLLK